MVIDGKGSQNFLTKSYESDRQKALEDRTKYTDAELASVEITTVDVGGGKTLDDTYEFKQYLYPMDTSIRPKEKLDLRDVDPSIGGR